MYLGNVVGLVLVLTTVPIFASICGCRSPRWRR
jgi:hypothetical protein